MGRMNDVDNCQAIPLLFKSERAFGRLAIGQSKGNSQCEYGTFTQFYPRSCFHGNRIFRVILVLIKN